MSLPDLIAIGLGFVLTAYAILAGADFGAGILDLTSGKSPEQRAAIARTIGPLWEANHVWLIFAITILFSAFPTGFAALGTVLLAPFTLAVMAIVVRGVAFGLRTEAAGDQARSAQVARPGVRSRERRRAAAVRRLGRRAGAGLELGSRRGHGLVAPLDGPVRGHRRAARGRAVRPPRGDLHHEQARAHGTAGARGALPPPRPADRNVGARPQRARSARRRLEGPGAVAQASAPPPCRCS